MDYLKQLSQCMKIADSLKGLAGSGLEDFKTRYTDHVAAKKAFDTAVKKAVAAYAKGAKVDVSKLIKLRNAAEAATKNVLGFKPPKTDKSQARNAVRDAALEQTFGQDAKAQKTLERAGGLILKHCGGVLKRYESAKSGDVPDDLVRAVLEGVALAQQLDVKGPAVSKLEAAIKELKKAGKLRGVRVR